jgi:hypothetical protein
MSGSADDDGAGGSGRVRTRLDSQGEADEPIVRFIEGHVSALEELEVMLLMRSTAPRHWRVEEVCRELGSSLRSIQMRLDKLTSMRIIDTIGLNQEKLYRYEPADEEIRSLIDGVAKLYKERRLFVIELVYGRPESDLHAFSEAFRFKKGNGGP